MAITMIVDFPSIPHKQKRIPHSANIFIVIIGTKTAGIRGLNLSLFGHKT
jgi:hypothetical protein